MKTADLTDHHQQVQVCRPGFNSYGGIPAFHGSIRTIRSFEDFSLVKALLSQPSRGEVLVVDAGDSARAMLGDRLAEMGVKNGWSGIVVNGLVRDSADIAKMPIGVMALGTTPVRSDLGDSGELDVTVEFAGVKFSPASYLYADEDGIIVSTGMLSLPD